MSERLILSLSPWTVLQCHDNGFAHVVLPPASLVPSGTPQLLQHPGGLHMPHYRYRNVC